MPNPSARSQKIHRLCCVQSLRLSNHSRTTRALPLRIAGLEPGRRYRIRHSLDAHHAKNGTENPIARHICKATRNFVIDRWSLLCIISDSLTISATNQAFRIQFLHAKKQVVTRRSLVRRIWYVHTSARKHRSQRTRNAIKNYLYENDKYHNNNLTLWHIKTVEPYFKTIIN